MLISNLFRAATASFRALPDYLIIGTQKGGTTSLYNYLVQHPRVAEARIKEVHYFDKKYAYGERWYRSNFALRSTGSINGEATPYYLYHPLAAERVAKDLPQVKLIVMLRNPVTRAYSSYQHQLRAGREELTFEQALQREDERLAGEEQRLIDEPGYHSYAHRKYSYRSRGIYVLQMRRWLEHFPRQQMLVMQSEDFYADPQHHFDLACDFIGLPRYEGIRFKAYNAHPYSDIKPETCQQLMDFYHPYNEELEALLGRSFSWEER